MECRGTYGDRIAAGRNTQYYGSGSGSGNRPQNMVSRIEGETEHPVDFMINFTRERKVVR